MNAVNKFKNYRVDLQAAKQKLLTNELVSGGLSILRGVISSPKMFVLSCKILPFSCKFTCHRPSPEPAVLSSPLASHLLSHVKCKLVRKCHLQTKLMHEETLRRTACQDKTVAISHNLSGLNVTSEIGSEEEILRFLGLRCRFLFERSVVNLNLKKWSHKYHLGTRTDSTQQTWRNQKPNKGWQIEIKVAHPPGVPLDVCPQYWSGK